MSKLTIWGHEHDAKGHTIHNDSALILVRCNQQQQYKRLVPIYLPSLSKKAYHEDQTRFEQ